MTLREIKKEMLQYTDFYGGDIPDKEAIKKAKSKKELADIIENHNRLMEDMLADAKSHLHQFKHRICLTYLY